MTDVWIVTASNGQQNAPDEVYADEQAAEARATELVVSREFRFAVFYPIEGAVA